jgi:uncharacterized OB-fold protein
MSDYTKPLPRIGPDSLPFWTAARAGELHLPVCTACGRAHLPAGPICPFCLFDTIAWRRASGRGVISTYTIVHKAWFPAFAADIPYNVIQVELEEGPRLTANLVQCPDGPRIGMPVQIVFDPVSPEVSLPRFRPR